MEGNLEFEKKEGGDEQTKQSIEALRGIVFNFRHPRYEELINLLVETGKAHPEWLGSSAWHRLIGSTPNPRKPVAFDTPDKAVSIFIQELADKFLSSS